jgi:hypothetical protein
MVQTVEQYTFIYEATITKLKSSEWTHAEEHPGEELSRV